eukprot:TRINITY_DN9747_c1_g1_i1.p1 TRINITY_DN9747_c1_g1~~TRINITY_DN9747_c1_g1_i1.p1  ORF type:complete len:751 (-),score=159.74 TRINITY_DN9747_c1_g1_i1:429-2681(-)
MAEMPDQPVTAAHPLLENGGGRGKNGGDHSELPQIPRGVTTADAAAAAATTANTTTTATAATPDFHGRRDSSLVKRQSMVNGFALCDAATKGDLEALQQLLETGCRVDSRNPEGYTALWCAVAAKQFPCAERLLKHHATVDAINMLGETPLYFACRTGDAPMAKLLVTFGASLDFPSGETASTPLVAAARNGKLDIVMHLVESGADIDKLTTEGKTAAAAARDSGHDRIYHYLTFKVGQRRNKLESQASGLNSSGSSASLTPTSTTSQSQALSFTGSGGASGAPPAPNRMPAFYHPPPTPQQQQQQSQSRPVTPPPPMATDANRAKSPAPNASSSSAHGDSPSPVMPPPQQATIPVYDLLRGIQQTAARSSSVSRVGTDAFKREASIKSELTQADGGTVQLKAFAPLAFAKLRHFNGVETEEYMKAWDLPKEKMSLDLGAGRSGSLFLKSNTDRFMLKTIPHAEVNAFLEAFEAYFKHVTEQPDSLIMRIFGLYRLTYGWSSTLYVIVFGNVMYDNASLGGQLDIYDLKGRVPKPKKVFQRRNLKGLVWKDKDLDRFFYLSNPDRAAFLRQLKSDTDFLVRRNFMDYSFLVAVRYLPPDVEAASASLAQRVPGRPNAFRARCGGLLSHPKCREVYYVGIIDCLTSYSNKKWMANLCKSVLWEQSTLSTVPSEIYAERFLAFIAQIFPNEEQAQAPNLASTHPNASYAIAMGVPLLPFAPVPRDRDTAQAEHGGGGVATPPGAISRSASPR